MLVLSTKTKNQYLSVSKLSLNLYLMSFRNPKNLLALTTLIIPTDNHVLANKKTVIYNDEEPLIFTEENFLSDKEVKHVVKMAKNMGFHQGTKDSTEKITFLPTEEQGAFDYGKEGEKKVSFYAEDYTTPQVNVLDRMENAATKWSGIKPHKLEDPMKTFSLLSALEDPHLDIDLKPHRAATAMYFLDDGVLSENEVAHASVIFPCVETADFSAQEWRKRATLCETATRHLRLTHEKLLTQLRKGTNEESAETRLVNLIKQFV